MHIRVATGLDRDDVHRVNWDAFPESERELVSSLAVNLLSEKTTPATLSLVAEVDGAVVGHIAFSPVTIEHDDSWLGYILAPLAVQPKHQKRHIGSTLIESGIRQLSEMDIDISLIMVYGDPSYYGRFGFSADTANLYQPPYPLQYPFGWQAIALRPDPPLTSPLKIACVQSLCNPSLW